MLNKREYAELRDIAKRLHDYPNSDAEAREASRRIFALCACKEPDDAK